MRSLSLMQMVDKRPPVNLRKIQFGFLAVGWADAEDVINSVSDYDFESCRLNFVCIPPYFTETAPHRFFGKKSSDNYDYANNCQGNDRFITSNFSSIKIYTQSEHRQSNHEKFANKCKHTYIVRLLVGINQNVQSEFNNLDEVICNFAFFPIQRLKAISHGFILLLTKTESIAYYAFTAPHWAGGFGSPCKLGAEDMRRQVHVFFYALTVMVGGVWGGFAACRVLAPVYQPHTSSAALSLVAPAGGLKSFARSLS